VKINDFTIRRLATLVHQDDQEGVAALFYLLFAEERQVLSSDDMFEMISVFYAKAQRHLDLATRPRGKIRTGLQHLGIE